MKALSGKGGGGVVSARVGGICRHISFRRELVLWHRARFRKRELVSPWSSHTNSKKVMTFILYHLCT